MHDIPDLTRLCTQQVKSSVSISSVVQDLKMLQLHSGNNEVGLNAYADALKKVNAHDRSKASPNRCGTKYPP